MTADDALNLSVSPSSAYREHPISPDAIPSRPSSQEEHCSFNDSGNEAQGIYSDDNGGYSVVTPAGSPYRIKTPKNVQSYSPPHNCYPDHTFIGCSSITDYEIKDKLGEGTFGEVHKGIHKKTKNVVALKRILMHNEKEGIPITAIREIKILRQLSSPNVVTLSDMAFEYGDKEDQPSIYMVFPYMDHDLAGLLENKDVKFAAPQVKCYLRQLLEGTFYLHQQKILHRDLKAANLLIDNNGILKIADFGLSRPIINDKSLTGCVVTRWYRSPELLLGAKRYTPAIDMWAIGQVFNHCVFGEMLKRQPILMGNSDLHQLEIIYKLCGTPTADTFKDLGISDQQIEPEKELPRRIIAEFERYGVKAADLMDKLLVLDPRQRLNAFQALDHDYLWTDPLPADPKDLPQYESSHEYNRRNKPKEKKEHKAEETSSRITSTDIKRPDRYERRERKRIKRARSPERKHDRHEPKKRSRLHITNQEQSKNRRGLSDELKDIPESSKRVRKDKRRSSEGDEHDDNSDQHIKRRKGHHSLPEKPGTSRTDSDKADKK
ncbi:kinase-like domain-containing protein [Glomus cerebriforme]|uniref:Kinase-like domain-containing protein n=1 Tax=Glomus cerebriforme TaxID=658196 RepID=A0A397SEU7_9GLOM|nr:kinase-like domain-containing protein [Glomus cerebriforme]